jgi:type II secretory pathway pseudopilin PulG
MNMNRRSGFALVELGAALTTVGVLLVVLAVGAPRSRHLGWQAGSIANLHEYAAVTASYAADYGDQFWSYSWPVGVPTPSQYPDLHNPPSDPLGASAQQAVDILRRRARSDMIFINSWVPSVLYPHLPLADYLSTRLPMRFTVSPGDRNRLLWSNDIDGFSRGTFPNQPDVSDPAGLRWPYSSSYRVPQAFFTPDSDTSAQGTLYGGADWQHFAYTHTFNFGNRRASKVNFPSQKVHVSDSAQWQGVQNPVFFAYPFARVPVLMVDGSARVRATSQANPGFQPNNPRSPFPVTLLYSPNPWEPPVIQGSNANLVGTYYWTRGGIQGRDFEGDEFSTSTW